MLGFFKKKSSLKEVDEALNGIKSITIRGLTFKIKKLQTLDHATGAKVMLQTYETYSQAKPSVVSASTEKKIISHMIDVFMDGVISPPLSRKNNEKNTIFVEDLFRDVEIYSALYNAVIEHTYGKKKILQN